MKTAKCEKTGDREYWSSIAVGAAEVRSQAFANSVKFSLWLNKSRERRKPTKK